MTRFLSFSNKMIFGVAITLILSGCHKEVYVIEINKGLAAEQSIKEIIIDTHHLDQVQIVLLSDSILTLNYDCKRFHELVDTHTTESAVVLERVDYPNFSIQKSTGQKQIIIHSQTDLYKEIQAILRTFIASNNY